MGAVTNIYQLIRDLIDEAKQQKNLELVNQLIEIKLALSNIQDENIELKKMLSTEKKIIRYSENPYITLEDDDKQIKYCSTCWGTDKKLIQFARQRCPVCNTWIDSC